MIGEDKVFRVRGFKKARKCGVKHLRVLLFSLRCHCLYSLIMLN